MFAQEKGEENVVVWEEEEPQKMERELPCQISIKDRCQMSVNSNSQR